MRVKLENDVFLVHFETRQHQSKFGEEKKDLVTVKCYIRQLLDVETKEKEVVSKGSATQHYRDKSNMVLGRKVAFTRALVKFDEKEKRDKFWKKYKKEHRYIIK